MSLLVVSRPVACEYAARMASLDDVRKMIGHNTGLATVAVARGDGTVHASVANVGVLSHPVTGDDVVGVVVRGNSVKLKLARKRGRMSFTILAGWDWAGVEGPAEIIGPGDPSDVLDADGIRLL